MAVTLRFQSSGVVPGRGDPVRMRGRNLTIGRAPGNDLVLPDPERQISKQHCVIEDHGGRVVVLDLSSNGTFLNYGKVPLGQVATMLNDGDVLCLGNYELVVEINDINLPDPVDLPPLRGDLDLLPPIGEPPPPGVSPRRMTLDDLPGDGEGRDFIDDLLGDGGPRGHAGIKRPDLADDGALPLGIEDDLLLGPADSGHRGASLADHGDFMQEAIQTRNSVEQIPDDWDPLADLMPEAPPGRPAPAPGPAPVVTRNPFASEVDPPTRPAPPPAVSVAVAPPPPVPVQTVATDAAARAFLRALGAGDVAIGDADLVAAMTRLGTAMGTMVQGLREVLMTRTAIKSEFRIEQTRIAAGGNNPLKFSVSPEQAIEAMVRPTTRGYLDAATAARQALDDIKAHEMAMMTGMEAAMKGILARLAPQVLEGKIEVSGGLGSLLKGRKARYWEVYEKMYAEISDQAESDFHELFSKEFARAYQDQMNQMKRPDGAADGNTGGQSDVVG